MKKGVRETKEETELFNKERIRTLEEKNELEVPWNI